MKTAISVFGRGVMYNFALAILLIVLYALILNSRVGTECEGWTCVFLMYGFIALPVLVTPIFWFMYSFYMNSKCPGSGYLVMMYVLTTFVHYFVSQEFMETRPRRALEAKQQALMDKHRKSDGSVSMNEEIVAVSDQMKSVSDKFKKQYKIASSIYFILLMISLIFYKCS
jgi:hypothetical protein